MVLALMLSLASASDDLSILSIVEVESALAQVSALHRDALEDENVPRMMCALPRKRALEELVDEVSRVGHETPSIPSEVRARQVSLQALRTEAQELAVEASRCVEAAAAPVGSTRIELDCGADPCSVPKERTGRSRRAERRQQR